MKHSYYTILDTDTSYDTIGAELRKVQDKEEKTLSFASEVHVPAHSKVILKLKNKSLSKKAGT